MLDRRLEIPRSALENFLRQSPTPTDKSLVKATLESVLEDPDIGDEVPFRQYKNAYVTWGGPWRIVYEKGNPIIHVLQIERESG